MKRLRLAIVGLTGCSGCQLTLLNCEDELLQLAERFEFACFPLACSTQSSVGPYDVALVEGCVSTADEAEFLKVIRDQSELLIAFGTCAAWGGVQAMPMLEPDTDIQTPQPLRAFVFVDGELYGCPPEKHELLKLLSDLLRGVLPPVIDYPVCTECKMRENPCLLTDRRQLCLGALTRGGCNARCPSLSVPCEGCRGAVPEENLPAALAVFAEHGYDAEAVMQRLSRFFPRLKP